MRTLTCPRCGNTFETNHSQAKYCPDCRYEAQKERARELAEKRRAAEAPAPKEEAIHFCDSPERIAICLNCPLPPEKCIGDVCKLLLDAPAKPYKRKVDKHGR